MVRKNITAKFCGWEFESEIKFGNCVDCSGLMRVEMEKLKDHHLVKPGDLFFHSRGQVKSSAILANDPGKTVVAAPLLWIRVKSDFVIFHRH